MVMHLTLDSSVLVAALRKNEKKHSESLRLLQQIKEGKYTAIEPYSVLIEVVAAIRRRTNSRDLAEKVKMDFLNIGNLIFVDIDSTLAENAATTAAQIGIRGMDAIVIQTAIEYSASLVSLDNEMLEKAKPVVKIKNW
jgi:predicted nucleic acid-binding protein